MQSFFDLFENTFKNLSRKKARSILTMCSIAVGAMMVVIVTVISSVGSVAVGAELESLGISGISISANASGSIEGQIGGAQGVTKEHLDIINDMSEVKMAMPLLMVTGTSEIRDSKESALVCGIDAGANQAISLHAEHGRMLSKGDILSASMVCVVDESLAIKAYGRSNIVGKSLTLTVNSKVKEFRIVGVAKAGSSLVQSVGSYIPEMVYIPYSTLQEISGENKFNQIAVRVEEGQNIEEIEAKLIKNLENKTGLKGYFRSDNLTAQREKLNVLMDTVTLILTVISGISLVVSGIGIMTIMLVSVNERMREVGIKKALGASNGRIMREFLAESVVISFMGSLVGLAAGLGFSVLGAGLFGAYAPIEVKSVLNLVAFTMAIGIVFGVYPAIKASRLNPVEALRFD